jgi:hypothetical protein
MRRTTVALGLLLATTPAHAALITTCRAPDGEVIRMVSNKGVNTIYFTDGKEVLDYPARPTDRGSDFIELKTFDDENDITLLLNTKDGRGFLRIDKVGERAFKRNLRCTYRNTK